LRGVAITTIREDIKKKFLRYRVIGLLEKWGKWGLNSGPNRRPEIRLTHAVTVDFRKIIMYPVERVNRESVFPGLSSPA